MSLVRQQLRRHVPASIRMRLHPPPAWTVRSLVATTPLDLSAAPAMPVVGAAMLAEHGLVLAADPFAMHAEGRWHVFFEALAHGRRAAGIGLMTSRDRLRWHYHGIVLAEPFHLSYPFAFEADGERWLMPESYVTGAVRLYRATEFPTRWAHETDLVTGRPFKDASVFRHDDHWWMLVETSEHQHDELCLYMAGDLRGPWTQHPASPVLTGDPGFARPAGRPFLHDGRLYRLAQDCQGRYGRGVLAVEILELTPTTYRERRLDRPVIAAAGRGWNAGASHHVDAHQTAEGWVCFVDGHE